jgi:hypothetical protein
MYAQSNMRSTRRTLRGPSVLLEDTMESRSAISNTFHDMEKRNPYQSKSRRRRSKPTPASVSSVFMKFYNIILIIYYISNSMEQVAS